MLQPRNYIRKSGRENSAAKFTQKIFSGFILTVLILGDDIYQIAEPGTLLILKKMCVHKRRSPNDCLLPGLNVYQYENRLSKKFL